MKDQKACIYCKIISFQGTIGVPFDPSIMTLRDELIKYLDDKGIGTIIHYPIPPHLSEAYRYLNIEQGSLPITEKYAKTVLSLPLYNGMMEEEQEYVIDAVNHF